MNHDAIAVKKIGPNHYAVGDTGVEIEVLGSELRVQAPMDQSVETSDHIAVKEYRFKSAGGQWIVLSVDNGEVSVRYA